MARAPLRYAETREHRSYEGLDPDKPVAGHYRMRLRTGGVFVGVRIWFGEPLDPVTGEELDRGPRWNAQINAQPADLDRCWPRCGGEPIDAAEYRYLTQLQEWGETNAPTGPQANPMKVVDLLTAPITI